MQCAAPACLAVSTSTCGACGITRYCSRACQVTHRTAHREFCQHIVDTSAKFHQANQDLKKKPVFAVMLSPITYDGMMDTLKSGGTYEIGDRQNASAFCLLLGDKPYEKGTSRSIHRFVEPEDPGAKLEIRSINARLLLSFEAAILRSGSYAIYAARVTCPEKGLDHERMALIYDGNCDRLMVHAPVPFDETYVALWIASEPAPFILKRADYESCHPSAPFSISGYEFS